MPTLYIYIYIYIYIYVCVCVCVCVCRWMTGNNFKIRTVAIFVTFDSQTVLLYTVCNYVNDTRAPSYRIVDMEISNVLLQT